MTIRTDRTSRTVRIRTDKTDKTIRKFVRNHLNAPKVLIVLTVKKSAANSLSWCSLSSPPQR